MRCRVRSCDARGWLVIRMVFIRTSRRRGRASRKRVLACAIRVGIRIRAMRSSRSRV